MDKRLSTTNEIPFGTTIDNEGNKPAMRSPIEKKEDKVAIIKAGKYP